MVSETLTKVVKHEVIVGTKVSCLIFAVQLILQVLPLDSSIFAVLTWGITPLLFILGFLSDIRFYTNLTATIRKERVSCNLVMFAFSWITSACIFRHLNLPWAPEEDKEVAEEAVKGLKAKLMLDGIMDDSGYAWGLVLLLGAHYSAVSTLVTCVRTLVFGLEVIVRKVASHLPVMEKVGNKQTKSE